MVVVKRLTAALLLTAAACGPGTNKTTYVDSGSVCFDSKADGTVSVSVTFPGCLSSSCSTVKAALCRITEKDGVILLSSYGEVEDDRSECTDDCGSFTAHCESAPIAPGTYTVQFGDQSAELTLPASNEQRFDDAVFRACGG